MLWLISTGISSLILNFFPVKTHMFPRDRSWELGRISTGSNTFPNSPTVLENFSSFQRLTGSPTIFYQASLSKFPIHASSVLKSLNHSPQTFFIYKNFLTSDGDRKRMSTISSPRYFIPYDCSLPILSTSGILRNFPRLRTSPTRVNGLWNHSAIVDPSISVTGFFGKGRWWRRGLSKSPSRSFHKWSTITKWLIRGFMSVMGFFLPSFDWLVHHLSLKLCYINFQ